MSVRKPLTIINGVACLLPAEDTLPPQQPAAHSHTIGDVAGLQAALDAKQGALGFKITVSPTEPASPSEGDVWISY